VSEPADPSARHPEHGDQREALQSWHSAGRVRATSLIPGCWRERAVTAGMQESQWDRVVRSA
jgi:hypothetical protein